MPEAAPNICPACGAPLEATRHDWLRRCGGCGFLASTLRPEINARGEALDEGLREGALAALRNANFEAVLDALQADGLAPGATILDVGCAHGWFLTRARERGFGALGIEPDRAMAAVARKAGLEIREDFFPDALEGGETFGAVVFNDVLEHVPDIGGIVRAVAGALEPGGLAAINLPLSTGVLYRVADAMDRFGVHGPFDRMWQRAFPSPHLSYVDQDNLARLALAAGLGEVRRTTLPSVTMDGLWERLTYDRAMPRLAAGAVWSGMAVVGPLLPLLPADIGLQIFRKPAAA